MPQILEPLMDVPKSRDEWKKGLETKLKSIQIATQAYDTVDVDLSKVDHARRLYDGMPFSDHGWKTWLTLLGIPASFGAQLKLIEDEDFYKDAVKVLPAKHSIIKARLWWNPKQKAKEVISFVDKLYPFGYKEFADVLGAVLNEFSLLEVHVPVTSHRILIRFGDKRVDIMTPKDNMPLSAFQLELVEDCSAPILIREMLWQKICLNGLWGVVPKTIAFGAYFDTDYPEMKEQLKILPGYIESSRGFVNTFKKMFEDSRQINLALDDYEPILRKFPESIKGQVFTQVSSLGKDPSIYDAISNMTHQSQVLPARSRIKMEQIVGDWFLSLPLNSLN